PPSATRRACGAPSSPQPCSSVEPSSAANPIKEQKDGKEMRSEFCTILAVVSLGSSLVAAPASAQIYESVGIRAQGMAGAFRSDRRRRQEGPVEHRRRRSRARRLNPPARQIR